MGNPGKNRICKLNSNSIKLNQNKYESYKFNITAKAVFSMI